MEKLLDAFEHERYWMQGAALQATARQGHINSRCLNLGRLGNRRLGLPARVNRRFNFRFDLINQRASRRPIGLGQLTQGFKLSCDGAFFAKVLDPQSLYFSKLTGGRHSSKRLTSKRV